MTGLFDGIPSDCEYQRRMLAGKTTVAELIPVVPVHG